MKKIRVLIVDDSALIVQILSTAIGLADDMQVIGTAADPFEAREKIKQLNPDVLTLDVEMPKMDGISFLANLMRLRPMPVLMISSLTTKASDVALRALDLGAIDYIAKPNAELMGDLGGFTTEVQEKIRVAAVANVRCLSVPVTARKKVNRDGPDLATIQRRPFKHMIAIGASTGGTEAIKEILMALQADCPPILIAQHIPESFSASFAARLNDCCPMRVTEATDNEAVLAGTAYVAPGDWHLTLRGDAGHYVLKLDQKPAVNRHRPAVDVLFDSVTRTIKSGKCIGVLLTGMGSDGAAALKRMHDAGFFTIAQDEASSVVWGMPGSAVKLDAADTVIPLEKISSYLPALPRKRQNNRRVSNG